jgi:hypothetical protein
LRKAVTKRNVKRKIIIGGKNVNNEEDGLSDINEMWALMAP